MPADKYIITASPTKDFFISMLVRDIDLLDAVADLVDNCVDGARRLRRGDSFKGLYVHISLSKDEFSITDNCGGIPIDLARDYAFRFGRPENFPKTKHSIGQFGIGMKRALFKMGREFRVESSTAESRFVVNVDVDEWKKPKPQEKAKELEGPLTKEEVDDEGSSDALGEWQFRFDELEEHPKKRFEPHTTITVKRLYEGVASQFELENFRTSLERKLTSTHQYSLSRGLQLKVGNTRLVSAPISLLSSTAIKPVHRVESLEGGIKVAIFAGISGSDPEKAGWNIFCNGRLIRESDQSDRTGWGEGHGRKIPRFHNQFAMFRGYVFFDADDPASLPWNTTKTDVDFESAAYQAVRGAMVVVMRPIIDFLNDLDEEKTEAKVRGPGLLEKKVATARPMVLEKLGKHLVFTAPTRKRQPQVRTTQRISYERPVSHIKRVKDALHVKTLRAVGERTFDYYFRVACKGQ